MESPTLPGVVHHWTDVRAFTDECSEARILAGFHYRFSVKVGQDMGYKIGEYVAKNILQPVAVKAEARCNQGAPGPAPRRGPADVGAYGTVGENAIGIKAPVFLIPTSTALPMTLRSIRA